MKVIICSIGVLFIIISLSMIFNPMLFTKLKYPPLTRKIRKSNTFCTFISAYGCINLIIGLGLIILGIFIN